MDSSFIDNCSRVLRRLWMSLKAKSGKAKRTSGYTKRLSLRELDDLPQDDKRKHDFLKAWKLIKELPPTNPNSFWSIATYHGMPFKDRIAPPTNPADFHYYWNGYCQHGNVLFPTWHRFYCLRLEQALQTVLPEGDVALHYWDQTSAASKLGGLPPILLQSTVTIDGKTVPNPLLNFTLPKPLGDNTPEDSDHKYYVKPAEYTTVRYPLSGIVHPPAAKLRAEKHNASIEGDPDTLLQENVIYWLHNGRTPGQAANSVIELYENCLDTPNFNAFSNVTSAGSDATAAFSIEQPHNDVHLMIGGWTQPLMNPDGSVVVDKNGDIQYFGLIKGASGDMGANEVASYDPIFFLHHCNIDRVFWIWQKKWGKTSHFEIDAEDGEETGTSSKTSVQGPTPTQGLTQHLSMDTILYPYQNELGVPRTSRDCINIETQLGYTYSIGSLDQESWPDTDVDDEDLVTLKINSWNDLEARLKEALERKKMTVSGVGKTGLRAFFDITNLPSQRAGVSPFSVPILAAGGGAGFNILGLEWKLNFHLKVENLDLDGIAGSFVVQAYYKSEGKLFYIGQRGILSRWDRKPCGNCRNHLKGAIGILLSEVWEFASNPENLIVQIISKDPMTGDIKITKVDATKAPEDDSTPVVRFISSLKQIVEPQQP